MPLRMVSGDSPPAIRRADLESPRPERLFHSQRARADAGAEQLATSLPPTLKAMNMPTTVASTRGDDFVRAGPASDTPPREQHEKNPPAAD